MEELLKFLDCRVDFLRGFGDEEEYEDAEEIYEAGIETGRFKESVFIRNKVKEMLSK